MRRCRGSFLLGAGAHFCWLVGIFHSSFLDLEKPESRASWHFGFPPSKKSNLDGYLHHWGLGNLNFDLL